MSTKKLFIVRHGETDFNKLGIVQGSGVDSPLNETGLEQARMFYEFYAHVPFDKVYISALQRTKQSVQQFLNAQFPHEVLPELNEISWGIYEGQQSSVDWKADYWQMIKHWNDGVYDVCVPGGETPLQLQVRQKKSTATYHEQGRGATHFNLYARAGHEKFFVSAARKGIKVHGGFSSCQSLPV